MNSRSPVTPLWSTAPMCTWISGVPWLLRHALRSASSWAPRHTAADKGDGYRHLTSVGFVRAHARRGVVVVTAPPIAPSRMRNTIRETDQTDPDMSERPERWARRLGDAAQAPAAPPPPT